MRAAPEGVGGANRIKAAVQEEEVVTWKTKRHRRRKRKEEKEVEGEELEVRLGVTCVREIKPPHSSLSGRPGPGRPQPGHLHSFTLLLFLSHCVPLSLPLFLSSSPSLPLSNPLLPSSALLSLPLLSVVVPLLRFLSFNIPVTSPARRER